MDQATLRLRIHDQAAIDGRALLGMSALLNRQGFASVMKSGSSILSGLQLAARTRVRLERHRQRVLEQSC